MPEIGPPLGRIVLRDQVRSKEKAYAQSQRCDGRYDHRQALAAQRQYRCEKRYHQEAEQPVANLAGQPGLTVLAQQSQVGSGAREPGSGSAEAPDQSAESGGAGLIVPGRIALGAGIEARQGSLEPGFGRD